MADVLTEALGGLQTSPLETGYGIATQALAQGSPGLITPYTSPGAAVGIGLGSVLLQSLLGYQARQSALQDTIQANSLANQMLKMQTPEERTSFIGGLDVSPDIGSRLSTLSTALTGQELARKTELDLVGGRETAKLKAMGEFYATPEGKAAQEAELEQIRAKAAAGRTPAEEWLARIAAQGEEQRKTATFKADLSKDAQEKQNAFTAEMKELDRKARSGDVQARLDFQAKQNEVNNDLKRELLELGVNAAVEKKRRIDEMTMQNQAAGQDPKLALLNAQAVVAKELVEAREQASTRLIEKAREEREKEASYKRTLELANPKAPAALVTQNVKRIGASNLAVELADEIDRYANWVTYRIGTAFSAADESALRSRLKKLTAEERLALSGTATNASERKDINEMLNGDFTAGPETKAILLRRFAETSRKLALDNMKGGFSSASGFIQAVEQGLQSGKRVEFDTPSALGNNAPQVGQSNAPTREELIAELKQRGVLK